MHIVLPRWIDVKGADPANRKAGVLQGSNRRLRFILQLKSSGKYGGHDVSRVGILLVRMTAKERTWFTRGSRHSDCCSHATLRPAEADERVEKSRAGCLFLMKLWLY
jgi:hypothetical protein